MGIENEINKQGKKYGYMRISTKNQMKDGTHRNQITALRNENVDDKYIYFDNLSGSHTNDRNELLNLLKIVKQNDEIVVTKLDRLARNTQDALKIAEDLSNRGVILNILNMGKLDNTPMGRVMFTIFSAFAEYELAVITERLQDGREWKRQNDPDYFDGRKRKLNNKQMKLMYERYIRREETIQEIADSFGIKSRKTVYNYLKRYQNEVKKISQNKNGEKLA